jgi:hypothetical protein
MKTDEQKREELTLKLRRAYDRFMATGRKLKASDRNLRGYVYQALEMYGMHADLSFLDVSAVTDMHWLFRNTDFDGDVSGWDVSNVRDMCGMFEGCPFDGDISGWHTGAVRTIDAMFRNSGFHEDISGWDTSSVECMDDAFNGADPGLLLNILPAWTIPSVRSCGFMFNGTWADLDEPLGGDLFRLFRDGRLAGRKDIVDGLYGQVTLGKEASL